MTNEQLEICKKAIQFYGHAHQEVKTIEECSELIRAISKMGMAQISREKASKPQMLESLSHVIEEMVDVTILITQLKIIYGEDEFEKVLEMKLSRLEKMID